MSQVTQDIASSAEESASGAEELSGQALELLSMANAFQLTHTARGRSATSIEPGT
jgi:methyl-accepting chemotaxis protein